MNKIMSSAVVAILSLLVVACSPGGSTNKVAAGGTPTATTGSVFGNAPPGTIIGVVCTLTDDDIKKFLSCPPPVSVLVGADGKYRVEVKRAVGNYDVFASLGGHESVGSGLTCGFSISIDGRRGGLFDCQHPDITGLAPVVFTPPSAVGLSFRDDGNPPLPDSHLSIGVNVPGPFIFSVGKDYEWRSSFPYLDPADPAPRTPRTGFKRISLHYDSIFDVISVVISKEDWLGNTMHDRDQFGNIVSSYHAELKCGVNADVQIGGDWYYKCSRFGVTFDKTRGAVSFDSTPTYWNAPAIPNFSTTWETGMRSPWSIVSGSLTFPPF